MKITYFIKLLECSSIPISYDRTNDTIKVVCHYGNYTLSFILYYSADVFDFIAECQEYPEVCECTFENLSHDDIEVRLDDTILELSEEELEQIDNIIFNKLY